MNCKDLNTAMREAFHNKGIRGENIVFALLDTLSPNGYDSEGHGTFIAGQLKEGCPNAKIRPWNVFMDGGTLTNVDYDIGGTGERSMWKLRNSKMNLNIYGNIFIDHLYVELSVASIVADEGMFESMTWYIYGSKFTVQTGNRIRVYNDDPIPNPEPAVTLISCDDSLYIIDAETYEYVNLGVVIESGNTLTFETPGNGSNDFYVESSTVQLTAMNQIRTPETVILGATITDADIYFLDGTIYRSMTDANKIDRFVQSDVAMVSTLGGYTGDILDIDDSVVSLLTYGDIDLTAATNTDLRAELDVVNSTLTMTSTTGGFLMIDASSAGVPCWNAANSTVNITVQTNAYVPTIVSTSSNISLRSMDGSIYFNKITARRSHIRLDAGRDIKTISESPLSGLVVATGSSITFDDKSGDDDTEEADDDSNASLTLKAGGDIGSSALWLYIDVPAALTVIVEHVTNLFADLCKRPLIPSQGYAVLTGYDENGVYLQNADGTNDYLRYSDERFFFVMSGIDTNAELAQFVAQYTADVYGSADRVWRNFIYDATALTTLITGTSGVTQASIAAVFGSKIASYVMAQVSGVASPTSADYMAAVRGAMNATATDSNYILTETEAESALTALLTNGLIAYTVDALGNTILGGTQMDLINYLFRNSSDYDSQVASMLTQAIARSNLEPGAVAAAITDAQTDRTGEEANLIAAAASLTDQVSRIQILSASLTDAKAAYDAATQTNIRNQKAAEIAALRTQLTAAEAAAGIAQAAMEAAQLQLASIQALLDALNHRLAQLNDSFTEAYTEAELKALFDAASATNAQDLANLAGARNAASQTSASLTDARSALKLAISDTDYAAIAAAAAAVSATDAAFRQADALVRLYTAAADASYKLMCALANTHVDPPARASNMIIGEIDGEAYLYNEGDITLTVSGSDITIANLRSERGDVTVTSLAGSIYGAALTATNSLYANQAETYKNDDGVHVNARYINLYAANAIGMVAAPLVTEQRDHSPVKVYNAESIYLGQQAGETVRSTEYGEAFGMRYEDLQDYLDETGPVAITLVYPSGMTLPLTIDFRDLRAALNVANTTGGPIVNLLQMASGSDLIVRFAAQAAVRYDWLRVDDKSMGTCLNATAGNGGIYISELTGDMNLGNVAASGDVILTAPGNIHGAEQTGTNLTAGGDASLTASEEIGTAADKLTVAVEGDMTAACPGSMYIAATGNLNLTASCGTGHIEITVSATSLKAGDLTLINTTPVTLTGYAFADGSVSITNNGNIGTLAAPFPVNTDANGDLSGDTLSLSGINVYVAEQTGDVIVQSIVATGDLVLTVPGSLYNASGDKLSDLIEDVREALAAANAARAAYDAALAEYNAITRSDEITRTAAENLAAQAALTAASGTNILAQASLTDAQLAYELNPTAENYVRMVGADAAAQAAAEALTDAQAAAAAAAQAAASATDYLAYTQALYDAAAGSYTLAGGDTALNAASSTDASAAEALAIAQAAYDADKTPANKQALDAAQAAYDAAHATYTSLLSAQAQAGDAKAKWDQAIVSYTNAVNTLAAASATNAAAQLTLSAAKDVLLTQMTVSDAQGAVEAAAEIYAASPTNENENRLKRAQSELDAAEALLAAQRAVKAALASGTNAELLAAQAAAEQAQAVYARFLSVDAAQETYDGYAAQTDSDLSLASATDALDDAEAALAQAQAEQAAAQAEYDAKKNTATPTVLAQLTENLNEAKALAQAAQADYDAAKLRYDKAYAAAELAQAIDDLQAAQMVILAQNELNRIKAEDPSNTERIAQAQLTLAAAEEAFRRNETVIELREELEDAEKILDDINAVLAASETDISAASDTNAAAQNDLAQAQANYASATNMANKAALDAAQAAADAAAQALYDTALAIYEALIALPGAQTLHDALTAALATVTDALGDSEEALAAFLATGAAMDQAKAAQTAYDQAVSNDNAANDLADEIGTKKAQAATETDAVNAAYAAYVSSTDMAEAEANRQAYDLAMAALNATLDQIAALEAQLLALTGATDTNIATTTSLASLTDAGNKLGDANAALALAQASQSSYATGTSTSGGYLPQSGTDEDQNPRIIVGGNAVITVGGSFGTATDAVTINADGTIAIAAGGGVFFESTGDVNIGHIDAGVDLVIVAAGDISDDASNTASIVASNTTLISLFSSVGRTGNPVNLNAGSISGEGELFNITDTGDTGVGNIGGGSIIIVSGGDVTQLPGTVILGDSLILTASGDVTIITDVNRITVTGGDIRIQNLSPALIVIQITGGDVNIVTAGSIQTAAGGSITADNLTILAAGDIGTPENLLQIIASGNTSLISIYGVAYFINRYAPPEEGDDIRRLTDKPTDVYVEGHICADAYLVVSALKLTSGCAACKLIKALIKKYGLIVGYNIAVYSNTTNTPYWGSITVSIPVGIQYNNMTFTVAHCRNGVLELIQVRVMGGRVTFTTDALSPFAVLGNGTGIPKTGDAGSVLPYWMIAMALLLLCGWMARRKRI